MTRGFIILCQNIDSYSREISELSPTKIRKSVNHGSSSVRE